MTQTALIALALAACHPPEPVQTPDDAQISGSATFTPSGWDAQEEVDLLASGEVLCRWGFTIVPLQATDLACTDYDGHPCDVWLAGELSDGADLGGCADYGWDDRYADGGVRGAGWSEHYFYGGIDAGPRLVWWDADVGRWDAVTADAAYDAGTGLLTWDVAAAL